MALGKTVFLAFSFIAVISKGKAQKILFTANPVHLPENRPANEVIATADDRLVYNPVTRYAISGNPAEFQIHPESGSITATKTFDYEKDATTYMLNIEKRLPNGDVDSRAILVINIINVEEAPECLQTEFTAGIEIISIDENYLMLNSIYKVDAKDQDIDDILTYTLQSEICAPDPEGKLFSVDNLTGVVSRTSPTPLDYDAGYHTCQLKIRVTDRSKLFCEGTLTININDLNDESPEFERNPEDTIEISENTPVGTIITTVKAIDKDVGSKISYSFSVPSEVFALNHATGILTLLKKLDLDNPDNAKTYPLLIEATDNDATHTAFYTLTIAVINERPNCDPRFSSGHSLIVRETFPVNEVVYTVLASDPDGDPIKFKLLSSSHNTKVYFNLNEDSGVITTTDVALDYEKDPKVFRMVISATNTKMKDSKSCTGMLTFNIMNANDETPVFKNLPEKPITFSEALPAGSLIFALRATDQDIDDIVRYEFVDNYKGFSINEDTGGITLSSRLDAEDHRHPRVQVVYVRAYDNDRVHSATAELSLSLLDVNDNSPKCEEYLIIIQLPETTPIHTSLLQLTCRDNDVSPPNNVLEFSMDLDAYSLNKFKLVHNEIILGPKGLDYDNITFSGMQFKHTLILRVSDKGEPSLTSTVTVIVRVTRVNEFKPVQGNNVFTVVENSELGTLVGMVKFTDDDWPFNNLKYTVVAGDFGTPPKFYIEPNTGNIVVLNALDRETQERYTASIQAIDLNNDIEPDPLKQLKSIALITINIQNVNDEPPVCNPASYEEFILSTNKAPFLQLLCSDKDSPNDQLSYAITGGNGIHRFMLLRTDNDPPLLATRQNFQYNVFGGIQDPTVFQLLIEVTDEQGGNTASQLTTTATVIVHVTPWTTTVPTKPSATATTPVTTSVVFKYAYVWNPDSWFPALLAITGVLLLLCLYALAWGILKDVPKYAKFFPLCHGCRKGPRYNTFGKANTGMSNAETIEKQLNKYEKSTTLPETVFHSTSFDGRAIDTASGRHYLFNSQTGKVQWLN